MLNRNWFTEATKTNNGYRLIMKKKSKKRDYAEYYGQIIIQITLEIYVLIRYKKIKNKNRSLWYSI